MICNCFKFDQGKDNTQHLNHPKLKLKETLTHCKINNYLLVMNLFRKNIVIIDGS